MLKALRFRLRHALAPLAVVLAATSVAPAHAVLIQGDWDPPFGAPFPDLGWRGTSTINVSGACLALSGVIINDGLVCPLMTVVQAEVGFYDLGDLSLSTVETLNFDSLVAVDRIRVNAGQVEAFALDSLGRVLSTSALGVTVPGGDQAYFSLELDFDAVENLAVLSWYEEVGNPASGRSDPAFPAIVRIQQFDAPPVGVPAPASVALVLLGLGLVAAQRRR